MKSKILILAIYPAPYRMELCAYAAKNFDADVFFENSSGDERDSRWFQKGEYNLLDTEKGAQEYVRCLKNIKEYDLVVLYDYATKEGRKLIAKCKKAKVPYVVNCDGVIAINKRNFIKDFVKKQLLKKATAYLASGQLAKEYFMRYGAKENEIYFHTFSTLHEEDILKNPLTAEEKMAVRERLNLPLDKKIAVAVGRFIPLKNYDRLISAWEKVDGECCLLLIGGGDEEGKYCSIIQEKGLKNVIIEGFHPKEELYEYYKAADVFIHTSSYEAWGLVVNEAMAHALPIVISDNCTVAKELIKDGVNGYKFPTWNEEKGVEQLAALLNDETLYLETSKNALETIRPYTIENMANTHVQVFEKLVEKNEE